MSNYFIIHLRFQRESNLQLVVKQHILYLAFVKKMMLRYRIYRTFEYFLGFHNYINTIQQIRLRSIIQ
ncbi:unnamed protein product (macronuclear) [Paramecium tetraurelia]|uniref:Uncharacterized protein n=1 Tax=Paramecium tetraurelia TaxID=5888 RepID=A0BE90_PARTE|nr:uncharacterized protein GSPATT00027890001 [Paramecium tetraurelia]CAK56857.1 unnamed protein product [Paramecium tetraurelia]|eukprot:XP_001424255.1 hypothetical protein (macronuclear) [Paramecium tetraurelia strain d4-2]